jgi:hypothetical protein
VDHRAARGAEMAAAERRSAVLGEGDGGGDWRRVGASRGQGRETADFSLSATYLYGLILSLDRHYVLSR